MMDLVPPTSRGSGLTMKEYDQHLARLNKENFALKLRIYFMEEQQGHVSQNAPQIYNNNIELKVATWGTCIGAYLAISCSLIRTMNTIGILLF